MPRIVMLGVIAILVSGLVSADPSDLRPVSSDWVNVGFPGRNIAYVTVHPTNPNVVFIQDSTVFTADMIDPG